MAGRYAALICMLLMCGCARTAELAPVARAGPTVTVVERGWHTDIALPTAYLSGPLADLVKGAPGVRFLVFGFGDRDYYMSPDEGPISMAIALFPGPGVVLVTALGLSPAQAFGADSVVTLAVTSGQFAAIAAFVRGALEGDSQGGMVRLGDGPYPGSTFYASHEIYDAFHNCNGWTRDALRSGGFPVSSNGVLFAGQVMELARGQGAKFK